MQPVFEFDAVSALSKGQRDYQEDAIITDFARGADVGVVVLADGMGGHAAGDVASKIVVTEVFSELMFQRGETSRFERDVPGTLRAAAMAANACLKGHVQAYPETHGMGATLVAAVVADRHLYWISIGDSPLFLFRAGALIQLNEDHSMAPQIDFMAKSGLLGKEEAEKHPDRNTLTSVLFGEDVPKIDCPDAPVDLQDGDILLVASDGLQFLRNEEIEAALRRNRSSPSADIADDLLQRVMALDDPDLDNVSFSIIKIQDYDKADQARAQSAGRSGIRCVG
ncbi:PP2C family protein-serine/threonine phosphatase [Roseobacter weihaiensis]|uniref:PP2C family protein-serine/threonine phosphatase n=1 Tax=Roseobacter weihaiensis TaxID=2763262 RepID=UPI001D0AA4A9|nr:protein phosphatase 2C domain-containing protein [Roseobacter sp. H9]